MDLSTVVQCAARLLYNVQVARLLRFNLLFYLCDLFDLLRFFHLHFRDFLYLSDTANTAAAIWETRTYVWNPACGFALSATDAGFGTFMCKEQAHCRAHLGKHKPRIVSQKLINIKRWDSIVLNPGDSNLFFQVRPQALCLHRRFCFGGGAWSLWHEWKSP